MDAAARYAQHLAAAYPSDRYDDPALRRRAVEHSAGAFRSRQERIAWTKARDDLVATLSDRAKSDDAGPTDTGSYANAPSRRALEDPVVGVHSAWSPLVFIATDSLWHSAMYRLLFHGLGAATEGTASLPLAAARVAPRERARETPQRFGIVFFESVGGPAPGSLFGSPLSKRPSEFSDAPQTSAPKGTRSTKLRPHASVSEAKGEAQREGKHGSKKGRESRTTRRDPMASPSKGPPTATVRTRSNLDIAVSDFTRQIRAGDAAFAESTGIVVRHLVVAIIGEDEDGEEALGRGAHFFLRRPLVNHIRLLRRLLFPMLVHSPARNRLRAKRPGYTAMLQLLQPTPTLPAISGAATRDDATMKENNDRKATLADDTASISPLKVKGQLSPPKAGKPPLGKDKASPARLAPLGAFLHGTAGDAGAGDAPLLASPLAIATAASAVHGLPIAADVSGAEEAADLRAEVAAWRKAAAAKDQQLAEAAKIRAALQDEIAALKASVAQGQVQAQAQARAAAKQLAAAKRAGMRLQSQVDALKHQRTAATPEVQSSAIAALVQVEENAALHQSESTVASPELMRSPDARTAASSKENGSGGRPPALSSAILGSLPVGSPTPKAQGAHQDHQATHASPQLGSKKHSTVGLVRRHVLTRDAESQAGNGTTARYGYTATANQATTCDIFTVEVFNSLTARLRTAEADVVRIQKAMGVDAHQHLLRAEAAERQIVAEQRRKREDERALLKDHTEAMAAMRQTVDDVAEEKEQVCAVVQRMKLEAQKAPLSAAHARALRIKCRWLQAAMRLLILELRAERSAAAERDTCDRDVDDILQRLWEAGCQWRTAPPPPAASFGADRRGSVKRRAEHIVLEAKALAVLLLDDAHASAHFLADVQRAGERTGESRGTPGASLRDGEVFNFTRMGNSVVHRASVAARPSVATRQLPATHAQSDLPPPSAVVEARERSVSRQRQRQSSQQRRRKAQTPVLVSDSAVSLPPSRAAD